MELGGLRVTTTLDLSTQNMAQLAVTEEVDKLAGLRVGNGAALVTNPQTGEILSMVGSKDYFGKNNDGNVNIAIRSRQPGSSIKPIMYASGFSTGKFTLRPCGLIIRPVLKFQTNPTTVLKIMTVSLTARSR